MSLTSPEKEKLNESLEEHNEPVPLECHSCGAKEGETYECRDFRREALCLTCGDAESDLFLCDGCLTWNTEYGPGKEECQGCYETSIDYAHDSMRDG